MFHRIPEVHNVLIYRILFDRIQSPPARPQYEHAGTSCLPRRRKEPLSDRDSNPGRLFSSYRLSSAIYSKWHSVPQLQFHHQNL
jgi:hypothetical protein